MTPRARGRATTPYRAILLIVVALILYGSLYPWQFQVRHYGDSPPWILLHSWPTVMDRYFFWDVAVNVALYMPLGIFGFLALSGRASRWVRTCLPLGLALVLSSCIEMAQLFDDSRQCSLSDVASNVTGAAMGIAAAAVFRGKFDRLVPVHLISSPRRVRGALLLIGCWLGYQLFPLFPVWGRTNLMRRLASLAHAPSLSPVETLLIFAEWLALVCLLDNVVKTRTTGILAVLLLVVPGQLIIAAHSLAWPQIAGAAAAYAAWLWMPRHLIRRAAPVLLTAALILSELSPFHFQGARRFSWIPFQASFIGPTEVALTWFFRKSFWYGSVLWLWHAAGYRLAPVTAAAAALLFLLERAQAYLPHRTPEITDAVLAVLMGVLLWLLGDG